MTAGFSEASVSKQATPDEVTTGSETPPVAPTASIVVSVGRSVCEPCREIVVVKADPGLQRICFPADDGRFYRLHQECVLGLGQAFRGP